MKETSLTFHFSCPWQKATIVEMPKTQNGHQRTNEENPLKYNQMHVNHLILVYKGLVFLFLELFLRVRTQHNKFLNHTLRLSAHELSLLKKKQQTNKGSKSIPWEGRVQIFFYTTHNQRHNIRRLLSNRLITGQ